MIATQEMAVSAVRFASDVLARVRTEKRKPTDDEVRLIRALGATGRISEMRIGLMFCLSQSRVSDICRGKTYRHVMPLPNYPTPSTK